MNDLVDNFAHRLSLALSIRNMKPIELAEITKIDKSKISSYMSGRYKAKTDGLKIIADALNVSPIWLMGYDVPMEKEVKADINSSPSPAIVFVYGSIPAGIPMEMIEEVIDTEEIPSDWLKGDKQYFGLKVHGNSMMPKYQNNDTIICLKCEDCESGDDCVVAVNGDDATFKKVIKTKNGIILQPLNPDYSPLVYSNDDIKKLPVRILGKVVELRRKI